MSRAKVEARKVTVAIMAKAPVPGFAKTRLIPALGADAAAELQAFMIEQTVEVVVNAALGPVMLWAAPAVSHPLFADMRARFGVMLRAQPRGDLGERMLAAAVAARGPVLIVGTDCPALRTDHLRTAATILHEHDIAMIPAEDGGYVLIGMRAPQPVLFSNIAWSTAAVMDETRQRMRGHGLRCCELDALWDVDTPDDHARLQREGLLRRARSGQAHQHETRDNHQSGADAGRPERLL
jgi:rSAM/selenodomain-associated transferase 1